MSNLRLVQAIACAFLFFCAAATAQSTTKTTSTPPPSAKAFSATLDGSHSTSKALQPRTLNELFQAARDDGHVNVIVTLDLGTAFQSEGLLSTAAVDQQRALIAQTRKELMTELTGTESTIYREYKTVAMVAIKVDEAGLKALMSSSRVSRINDDALNFPSLQDSTGIIGADSAWAQGYDGTGQAVVIVDTGIDGNHEFFKDANNNSRIVAEACFSNQNGTGDYTSLCPDGSGEQTGPGAADATIPACEGGDLCDHGSHVAGIAAGYSSGARKGVAPNADIIAIQVFSRIDDFFTCLLGAGTLPPCTTATDSDLIAALDYVNDELRPNHDVASVNMSLGGASQSTHCDDDNTKPSIDNLRSAGIATAIATGNSGQTGEISSPACVSTSIAVGSTDKQDNVSSFSDVADIMDLFAPGSSISSSVPGGYGIGSGTSMATPHVAGAWAVMKQAFPNASVDDILTAFKSTGIDITDQRSGGTVTKPRIQVDSALGMLGNADFYDVTPSVGSGQGSISPSSVQSVVENGTASFTLNPDPGYVVDNVTGSCGGTLSGNNFSTDPVTGDCNVIANFKEFDGDPLVCGSINESLLQTGDGSTFDFITGQFGTYSPSRADDINLYDFGDGMYVYWYGDVHSLDIGGVVDSSGEFDVLQAGTTVGQASNFSAASLKMENWTSGASGYLGIAFENADTGILNYGWIEMTTSSPGGYPASWGDYCYDQTGADIIIDGEPVVTYAVTPSVGTPAGSISPNTPQNVTENSTTNFTLAPEYGYMVDDVTGSCGGTLSGNSFTTDPITADCSVVVNFKEDPNSASVLYDQTGNTTNTGSVAFLDLDDPVGYETQAADDFIVPAGEEWTVEEFYINGFHHPDYPGTPTTSANVFIYQDDNGSPGSEVDAFLQMSPQDNDGELTLTLPGSGVVLQPGIYWVSVQPERDWFGEGPWYWLQEDSSNGAIFHWRNPGDGFGNGCIDWGPGDLCVDSENDDLSFQIRGHKDDLEADTWTVSPGVGSGQGSISPSSDQTVDEGDTITFTLTPDTGYEIDGVTGSCGGTLSGNAFTTDPVTADCDVVANFVEEPAPTWTVSPGVGSGQGSISPSGNQTVDEDDTITFTLTPDAGYELDDVTGSCGGTLSGNAFTTDPVTADCDVIANFAEEEAPEDGIFEDRFEQANP